MSLTSIDHLRHFLDLHPNFLSRLRRGQALACTKVHVRGNNRQRRRRTSSSSVCDIIHFLPISSHRSEIRRDSRRFPINTDYPVHPNQTSQNSTTTHTQRTPEVLKLDRIPAWLWNGPTTVNHRLKQGYIGIIMVRNSDRYNAQSASPVVVLNLLRQIPFSAQRQQCVVSLVVSASCRVSVPQHSSSCCRSCGQSVGQHRKLRAQISQSTSCQMCLNSNLVESAKIERTVCTNPLPASVQAL